MGRNNQQRRKMKSKARQAARRTQPQTAGFAPGASGAFGAGGGPWAAAGTAQPSSRLSLAEEARAMIERALWATNSGPDAQEAALGHLLHLSSHAPGRLTVRRELVRLIRWHMDWAWRHGWQPADLHRFAARGAPAAAVGILDDAMAEDLARYAAGSVDPRWHAQLRELSVASWWAADSDYLAARAACTPEGWDGVCPAALTVIDMLAHLPVLERLGPLPGEATAADQAATEPVREVDERLLSKVRALLAKAESTTFEAEAETFTAGAQALMARHSIDAALLDAAGRQHGGPEAIRIGIDRPYEGPKAILLHAVADANRCRTVWSEQLGFATVLGFAPDLRAVETLFTSLLVQATEAIGREGSRRTSGGQSRTRSFRQSFLTAFAARIGERLREVTQAEVDKASAADANGAADGPGQPLRHGRELVPVLAARSQAVDDATKAMFPHLTERVTGRVRDPEGWHSGRAAADRASLDLYAPLDSAG